MKLLSTYGMGLLVGAALSVVIPEYVFPLSLFPSSINMLRTTSYSAAGEFPQSTSLLPHPLLPITTETIQSRDLARSLACLFLGASF